MRVKYVTTLLMLSFFYFGYLMGSGYSAEEYHLEVKALKMRQEKELEFTTEATKEAAYDAASTKFTDAFRENCGQENGGKIILENRRTKKREVYRCSLVEEFIL